MNKAPAPHQSFDWSSMLRPAVRARLDAKKGRPPGARPPDSPLQASDRPGGGGIPRPASVTQGRAPLPSAEGTKQCSACKQVKPRSEFGRYAARKDGLQGKCKVCTNAYLRERAARLRRAS